MCREGLLDAAIFAVRKSTIDTTEVIARELLVIRSSPKGSGTKVELQVAPLTF
jgi:hypothetical protein